MTTVLPICKSVLNDEKYAVVWVTPNVYPEFFRKICILECPDNITWELFWTVEDQFVLVRLLKKADRFYVEQQSSEACSFLLQRFTMNDQHQGELLVDDFSRLVLNNEKLYPNIRFTNSDGRLLEVYLSSSSPDVESVVSFICLDEKEEHVENTESQSQIKIIHRLFDLLPSKTQDERKFDELQKIFTKMQNAYSEWIDFSCPVIPMYQCTCKKCRDTFYIPVKPDQFTKFIDHFVLTPCPTKIRFRLHWDNPELMSKEFNFVKKKKVFAVVPQDLNTCEYQLFIDNLDKNIRGETLFKDKFNRFEFFNLITNNAYYGRPTVQVFTQPTKRTNIRISSSVSPINLLCKPYQNVMNLKVVGYVSWKTTKSEKKWNGDTPHLQIDDLYTIPSV